MNNFTDYELRRMMKSHIIPATAPTRNIIIGNPTVTIRDGYAEQACIITLGNITKNVNFSVEEQYAKYLCFERGDAYLIGLLSLAMRERCNIISEVPITKELAHQIETELLPHLIKYAPSLHAPRIIATLDDTPLSCENKTATGCSCGIDSLHAIKHMSDATGGCYDADYLVINNVGAYSNDGKTSFTRYNDNVENAKKCASFLHKPLIITNSNFADTFPQEHLFTHLYSSCFAIYMLRKLWSRYYYASLGDEPHERIIFPGHEFRDPCCYDVIALPAFSIPQLRICNEGAHSSRFEKTISLLNYEPARKYLNVCLIQGSGNCGFCTKCKRTLWALDALERLDDFAEVFPVDNYKKMRNYYLRELYLAHRNHVHMTSEAYNILRKDMSLLLRLHALLDEKLCHSRCGSIGKRIVKHLIRK